MSRAKKTIFKTSLETLYHSGLFRIMAPMAQGSGVIFTLHRVEPDPGHDFWPNKILTITPEFLKTVIERCLSAGLDVVSLDEMTARLEAGETERRFAVFTLDDGYRDNLTHAYSVFKDHDCPFAIYLCSGLPDGDAELWWLALEEIIRRENVLSFALDGDEQAVSIGSTAEKTACFERIYWWLRAAPVERQYGFVRALCKRYGYDMTALCRGVSLSWDEVRRLSADPLVTIGAHTARHLPLAKLSEEAARDDIENGAARLSAELGVSPQHFAYPYGDLGSAAVREFALADSFGFRSAVTTRPDMLDEESRHQMHALPRVSLNGLYQEGRYVDVFLSGAPFALYNGLKRLCSA